MGVTTNVTMTGVYLKVADNGDKYTVQTIKKGSSVEFVLSTGVPSESLYGHPLKSEHGANYNTFGENDVYLRGRIGEIVALTK